VLFASSNGRRVPRLFVCPYDASRSQLFADPGILQLAALDVESPSSLLVVTALSNQPYPCPISARPLLPPCPAQLSFRKVDPGCCGCRCSNERLNSPTRLSFRALRAHQLRQLIASSCCNKTIPQLADKVHPRRCCAVHCCTDLLLTPHCRSLY
jgi:hypothetical protein